MKLGKHTVRRVLHIREVFSLLKLRTAWTTPWGFVRKKLKHLVNRIVCMRLTMRKYYCCKIISLSLRPRLITLASTLITVFQISQTPHPIINRAAVGVRGSSFTRGFAFFFKPRSRRLGGFLLCLRVFFFFNRAAAGVRGLRFTFGLFFLVLSVS